MSLTCLLIDDERLARVELRRMLSAYPSIQIIGEAKHADEAQQLIDSQHPDFIFLDIKMPGKSGFDLLNTITHQPKIIFVTAFDQYAIKAFEHQALDYLLKPINPERLKKCVLRIQGELQQESKQDKQYPDYFFVHRGKEYQVQPTNEILFIESLGNYAQIHSGQQKGLIKSSLNQLETRLDPKLFFRINRSKIINLQRIEKVWAVDKILRLKMQNQLEFSMSERKSIAFKKLAK